MTLFQHYQKRLEEFQDAGDAGDDQLACELLVRANDLAEAIICSDSSMSDKLAIMIGYCGGLDHHGTMQVLRRLQEHAWVTSLMSQPVNSTAELMAGGSA